MGLRVLTQRLSVQTTGQELHDLSDLAPKVTFGHFCCVVHKQSLTGM